MKLASLRACRDGRLIVVDDALTQYVPAGGIEFAGFHLGCGPLAALRKAPAWACA